MAQTITSMLVASTCRLYSSRTLNLLPCISSHMVLGNPVNSLNHAAICAISNRTFYKQWILQYPQRFDFVLHWNGCPAYLKTDIRFLVIQICQTWSHLLENAPFQNPAKHKTSKPSNNSVRHNYLRFETKQ